MRAAATPVAAASGSRGAVPHLDCTGASPIRQPQFDAGGPGGPLPCPGNDSADVGQVSLPGALASDAAAVVRQGEMLNHVLCF